MLRQDVSFFDTSGDAGGELATGINEDTVRLSAILQSSFTQLCGFDEGNFPKVPPFESQIIGMQHKGE